MNEKELKQKTDETIDSLSEVSSEDLDKVDGGDASYCRANASRCGGTPLWKGNSELEGNKCGGTPLFTNSSDILYKTGVCSNLKNAKVQW